MENLSNYDYVFGAILLISTLLALIRGGVAELLSLSTWFIAIFVMRHFADQLERYIPDFIAATKLRSIVSYAYSFFIVAIIITFIKKIFNQLISRIGLGGINHLLGALLGLIRGIIISALLILVIENFNLDNKHGWQLSRLNPILTPVVKIITNALPNGLVIREGV